MANKIKGEISVLLNGEEHVLKYDMNSMCEIEDRLGVTGLDSIMNRLQNIDFKTLRLLLWSGLIHAHMDENGQPTLKITEVGGYRFNMIDVIEKIAEAVQLGMGIEQEEADTLQKKESAKKQNPKKAQTK